MFTGLVWLTSNHMFGSGDFWDKSLSGFLKILKISKFQKGTRKIDPKSPSQTRGYYRVGQTSAPKI